MTLQISELRRAIGLILEVAERENPEGIQFDQDLYWSVPAPALNQVEVKPSELTLGSVADDWQTLLEYGGEPELVAHAMEHAAGLIRAIGVEVALGRRTRQP